MWKLYNETNPCTAHLNQVLLFLLWFPYFSASLSLPLSFSLSLVSFTPCCFKKKIIKKRTILFDIVGLERKRSLKKKTRLKRKMNCICFTLISKLQATAFQIKSEQMQKKKKNN